MLLFALFALVFAGANADEASIATQNDEMSFMDDAEAEQDAPKALSFDGDMEAPSRFNLTVSRRAIIIARRLSVSVPLMLSGNGINTSYRHAYCFRRLSHCKSGLSTKIFMNWIILVTPPGDLVVRA